MPLREGAVRKILEKHIENQEEQAEEVVSRRGVLEVALRRGFEQVLTGEVNVEARDLIALAQQLEKMDSDLESAAVEEAKVQVSSLLQAIRKVVPTDMWPQILRVYNKNLDELGFAKLSLPTENAQISVQTSRPEPL